MSIISQQDQERHDKAVADVKAAIAAVFGPKVLQEAAEAVVEALPDPDETERLAFALHRVEAHPDFEYTTTTATAKVYPFKRPDGEGWEANEAIGGGHTRDEHNDIWHWRRSIEYKRGQERIERAEAEVMAKNFRHVGGLLREWKDEAETLVDRERFSTEAPMGVGLNKTWHRIISNALGHPELPARLGPLFALQLNAVFGMAAEELERHPEKREDEVYVTLHDLAEQLFQADVEIKRK